MNLKPQKILGLDITISSKAEILEETQKYLKQFSIFNFQFSNKRVKPLVIFTPNPEIITYAQKDKEFKRIINSAQINLPDGAGAVWALKKLYGKRVPKISGIDFMLELVKLAEKESLRIGLIGGKDGVAVHTRECLLLKYPRQKIEVIEAPEIEIQNYHRNCGIPLLRDNSKLKIKQESDKDTLGEVTECLPAQAGAPPMVEELEEGYFNQLAREIVERKIDILFVAFGHPKQEYFIESVKRKAASVKLDKPLLMMAVGGSFDYISGRVPRAPKWLRDRGFEWLYRLIREPWRIGRQLKGAEFFWKILTS